MFLLNASIPHPRTIKLLVFYFCSVQNLWCNHSPLFYILVFFLYGTVVGSTFWQNFQIYRVAHEKVARVRRLDWRVKANNMRSRTSSRGDSCCHHPPPTLVVLDRMLLALTHRSSLQNRATFSWPTLYLFMMHTLQKYWQCSCFVCTYKFHKCTETIWGCSISKQTHAWRVYIYLHAGTW